MKPDKPETTPSLAGRGELERSDLANFAER
jgi:hypothetical protein